MWIKVVSIKEFTVQYMIRLSVRRSAFYLLTFCVEECCLNKKKRTFSIKDSCFYRGIQYKRGFSIWRTVVSIGIKAMLSSVDHKREDFSVCGGQLFP